MSASQLSNAVVRQIAKQMAGVAGFEPANTGVKVLCLTAWRHPTVKNNGVSSGIRTHGLQGHNLAL